MFYFLSPHEAVILGASDEALAEYARYLADLETERQQEQD